MIKKETHQWRRIHLRRSGHQVSESLKSRDRGYGAGRYVATTTTTTATTTAMVIRGRAKVIYSLSNR